MQPAEPARCTLARRRLADGEETTLSVVRHVRRGLRVRVRVFRQPRRLDTRRRGIHAASHQFDSDITDGRHPRAAIGLRR